MRKPLAGRRLYVTTRELLLGMYTHRMRGSVSSGRKATKTSRPDEDEDPADRAAVEGERRSRKLQPWGVLAFGFRIALLDTMHSMVHGMERLRAYRAPNQ
jgi:hypothetical protein